MRRFAVSDVNQERRGRAMIPGRKLGVLIACSVLLLSAAASVFAIDLNAPDYMVFLVQTGAKGATGESFRTSVLVNNQHPSHPGQYPQQVSLQVTGPKGFSCLAQTQVLVAGTGSDVASPVLAFDVLFPNAPSPPRAGALGGGATGTASLLQHPVTYTLTASVAQLNTGQPYDEPEENRLNNLATKTVTYDSRGHPKCVKLR
jgi:hypothetical protein